jgi:NADPH-dependent glutamate synthase beta subunit-like oxidoreductase
MTALTDIPTTEAKVTHRVLVGHRIAAGAQPVLVLGVGKTPQEAVRNAQGAGMDGVVQLELAGCTREVATYLKIHADEGGYKLHASAPLPEGLKHLVTAS